MTPLIATMSTRVAAPLLPEAWVRLPADGRVVYLTFDDGPEAVLSPLLLDFLARNGVRATHFLIGKNAQRHPAHVRDLIAAGHVVGNHTFTHPDGWRTPASVLLAEYDRTHRDLQDLTGRSIDLIRPPYGHLTPALVRWCRQKQQRMVLWDVMPGDYLPDSTASSIARFTLSWVRPGSIVVLHENPKCTHFLIEALGRIIDRLRSDGYTFDVLPVSGEAM